MRETHESSLSSFGGGITSFDADGFTLGTWSTMAADTENYVKGQSRWSSNC